MWMSLSQRLEASLRRLGLYTVDNPTPFELAADADDYLFSKILNNPHHTHTHTRLTALFSETTQVSRYQKGKTNLDFTEARDSECLWHQLGHMQVCTSLQTDNHASTPPLGPSCRPTNSVKALKAQSSPRSAQISAPDQTDHILTMLDLVITLSH